MVPRTLQKNIISVDFTQFIQHAKKLDISTQNLKSFVFLTILLSSHKPWNLTIGIPYPSSL